MSNMKELRDHENTGTIVSNSQGSLEIVFINIHIDLSIQIITPLKGWESFIFINFVYIELIVCFVSL